MIKDMKKAGHLDEIDFKSAQKMLVDAELVAKKVSILRHNAFAHRSKNISYNDAFKKADVTPDELRELTEMALKLANLLLAACGKSGQDFRELPLEAAKDMMNALAQKSR